MEWDYASCGLNIGLLPGKNKGTSWFGRQQILLFEVA